jgi:hypothetical protein
LSRTLFRFRKRATGRHRSGIFTFCICWFGISRCCFACLEDRESGARPFGLAGACVAVPMRTECPFYNAAHLGAVPKGAELLFYYFRPFGFEELDQMTVSAALTHHNRGVALAVNTMGGDLYRETLICLAASHSIIDGLFLGTTLRYGNLNITRYGSASTFVMDLGLALELTSSFNWGIAVRNVNHATIGRAKEELPRTTAMGVSLFPVDRIRLVCDVYKDVRFPVDFRCGVEFMPSESLTFRVGCATRPVKLAAGLGAAFHFFRFDYALATHSELGLSHLLSLQLHRPGR